MLRHVLYVGLAFLSTVAAAQQQPHVSEPPSAVTHEMVMSAALTDNPDEQLRLKWYATAVFDFGQGTVQCAGPTSPQEVFNVVRAGLMTGVTLGKTGLTSVPRSASGALAIALVLTSYAPWKCPSSAPS